MDLGYEPSSDMEEGDSKPEVHLDVDGSDEAGGAESSCVEEEEEEMDGEGPISGAEMVRVERVTVDHELYTASASCFCAACRVCDYDKCFVFAEYPALVPKLELSVVEERVTMDTGVDPAGVDAGVGGGKK